MTMMVLRASAADRWARCAFSAHLERHPDALPPDDGDEAMEGTAAAWAAEQVINGMTPALDDLTGTNAPNGVQIDKDMVRHLREYVALAGHLYDARAEVYREAGDDFVKIAGTSDLQGWNNDRIFAVVDLKYGYGIVEPTTLQVMAYAALAYWGGVRADLWSLSIYQPRAVHPSGIFRTVTYTQDQIERGASALWQAAYTAAGGQGAATPGDQCDHCLGAAKCTALTHSVYALWKPLQDRTYTEPTHQQIADELEMLDQMQGLIKARKSAVEAEAKVRLDRGKFIPGWAMMPQTGQRKFSHGADTIQAMTGVDPRVITTCTPAELERRGAPKKAVDALSHTPTVGYKLQRYRADRIAALFGEGK